MHRTTSEPPAALVHAVDRLIRFRLLLLLLCIASAVAAFRPSQRLGFDRSVEGLFHSADPRLVNYLEDKELFGGTETALVAYADDELLTKQGLNRLAALAEQLRKIRGVESVLSLAHSRLPGSPLSPQTLREHMTAGNIPAATIRDEILACELYQGRLISPDGKTTVLLVSLVPGGEGTASRPATIREIRQICDAHTPQAVVAGGPVLIEDVYTQLEYDGRLLGTISSVVLAAVIALLFRNLRWVLLPLAVVHLTLIWTKAVLVFSGTKLSMVSSPLVALVTVIGVATVMHVTIRFREQREQLPPEHALGETLVQIGPAIFWTCATTMAGFSALLACRVAPVAGFGMMMALGSGLVFVAAAGLIPPGVLLGKVHVDAGRAPGESRLSAFLDRIASVAERHPRRLALAGLAVLGIAALGIFRLEVATDFDENFRSSSRIVTSYRFIADRMEATGAHDVLIDAPDVKDRQAFDRFLQDVRSLQRELSGVNGVKGTLSIADVLQFVGGTKKDRAGTAELFAANMLESLTPAQRLALLHTLQPALIGGFWNRKNNVVRIVVQTGPMRGAVARREMFEAVERRAREKFPSARTAGVDILLSYMVMSLLTDQWLTFGLAVAAIVAMVAIAFRDWRLGLISLIPNAAPIIVVVGTMGWAGLKVDMATAMLASISMGLAVDFSIHYLYRFRRELRQGQSVADALRCAHGSVGLALVLASMALTAGFLSLAFSAFVPTVHFGILASVAMIGGLVGNLILLPILLRLIDHSRSQPGGAK
jgi:hypothetical protein